MAIRFEILLVVAGIAACGSSQGSPASPEGNEPTREAPASRCESAGLGRLEASVGRPSYDTTQGRFSAGTAFALSVGPALVLVTAHHVFGPDGGLARANPAAELPSFVTRVEFQPGADVRGATSRHVVPIADARAFSGEDYGHDIAAFALEPGSVVITLEPTTEAPRPGSRVYLLAPLVDGDELCHPARVVSTDGALVVVYDESLNLIATSGAPIVDETGRVLGINVGGGSYEGRLISIANPTRDFLPRLQTGLAGDAATAP